MSFPRYERYKNSGVEWLGAVPVTWRVSRLGFESWVRARLGWRGLKADEYVDGGYAFLSTPNIKPREIDFENVNYISEERYAESPEIQLRNGDVLLAKDGSTLGTVNVVRSLTRPATVNGSIAVITPNKSMDGVFLHYLFQSGFMKDTIQRIKGGMGVPHLFQDDLNKFYIPVPSIFDQTQIALFLDIETKKLEELNGEQLRLIELLKEKRQAVISHAVTKGLDASCRMKASGVGWLGNIPASWEVVASRRLLRMRNELAGDADQQLTASQKYGMLFQTDFVELEGRRVVEVIQGKDSLRHVEPNDFVISLRSFQGGIEWCKLAGSVTFHYVVLVPIKDVHPPFFAYLFKSMAYIQALRSTTNLIRDGQDLRYSHFALIDLPLVPIEEQQEIASYLDNRIAQIDALRAEAHVAIERLEERRAALISAAVTGKIDVRNYTPKDTA
jgi:type I restriction enzyme, S subunit